MQIVCIKVDRFPKKDASVLYDLVVVLNDVKVKY